MVHELFLLDVHQGLTTCPYILKKDGFGAQVILLILCKQRCSRRAQRTAAQPLCWKITKYGSGCVLMRDRSRAAAVLPHDLFLLLFNNDFKCAISILYFTAVFVCIYETTF